MLEQIKKIESLIDQGAIDEAMQLINDLLNAEVIEEKDKLYYIRGNIFRKKSDWHQAMNDYQKAIDLNPQSPAVNARKALLEILNFYNKDMYNQ